MMYFYGCISHLELLYVQFKRHTCLYTVYLVEVFDDAELAEIMKSVGTWYNTSIIFHSPDLLKQRIHFRFPRTTSLEEVVQALNDLGIAKLEQKKGKVIISNYSPKH